jgi:acyl-CoA thioesterase FadM
VREEVPVDAFLMHVNLRDTDAAGVIFNTVPGLWAEIGIENLHRLVGKPLEQILPRDLHYPIVSVKIDHFKPIRLGDRVVVKTGVVKVGRRSVEMLCVMSSEDGVKLCQVRRVAVAASRSSREVEAEPWLREIVCDESALDVRRRKDSE